MHVILLFKKLFFWNIYCKLKNNIQEIIIF